MARQLNLPVVDPRESVLRKQVAESLVKAIELSRLRKGEAARKLGVSRTALFDYLKEQSTIGVLPLLRAIEHLGIVVRLDGKTIKFDED
jgi:predicted transcriptional regulator